MAVLHGDRVTTLQIVALVILWLVGMVATALGNRYITKVKMCNGEAVTGLFVVLAIWPIALPIVLVFWLSDKLVDLAQPVTK